MNDFGFDPKENLWKQEFKTLGVEHNIGFLAGAELGLTFGKGVLDWFQGSSDAKKQQQAEDDRVEALNDYNKEKFENDKYNYYQTREFNYQQALKKYKYDTQMLTRNYAGQVEAYVKDQENLGNQLNFNKQAEMMGYLGEQNIMKELRAEQTFGRESLYIDGMKKRASLVGSTSGGSSKRAAIGQMIDTGRKMAILNASYTGAFNESALNMLEISMRKTAADNTAIGKTMLMPKPPLPLIKPEYTPEMKFTEPAEAIAGYVPQPSLASAVVGGISAAVGAFGNYQAGLGNNLDNSWGEMDPSRLPSINNPGGYINK